MNKELKEKLYKNALIGERLTKLDKKERQKIVLKLLETRSERELERELGIGRSTIHDWKTLRQDNTGKNIHVSLALIHRKLKNMKPGEITDWGRIEMIREICEKLLRSKR